MNVLRWLLSTQLKQSHKHNKNSGFTLIELLVAMVLAFLIITPLLGFMISILDTDRKEQAKVNSEQEIKSALDYIARDLQQALYVYDGAGITAIQSELPTVTGGVPVLVFWKREIIPETVQIVGQNGKKDDSFVYSLVAYYLIKKDTATWSKAARIGRFQIKDGIIDKNTTNPDTPCSTITEKYSRCPDIGFKSFDLSQKNKSKQEKMNSWKKATDYDLTKTPVTILVDFIDQTTTAQGAPSATTCPVDTNNPRQFELSSTPSSIERTGFYACVDSLNADDRSIVEVYLRGNALARLNSDDSKILYNASKSSYFPTNNIKVEGRSFVFSK